MTPIRATIIWLAALLAPIPPSVPANAQSSVLTEKMNAYVGCINRESGRAYQSRERYFSWVGKDGPTGSESIVYGTYTIYDIKPCADGVTAANAKEPHEPELEALGTAYVDAIAKLAPLLKEADDYYEQQNYKDDHMAKGRKLHPRLVAAWAEFATADRKLHAAVDTIQEKTALADLAEIERTEGRKAHYRIKAVMIRAKALIRLETSDTPDLPRIAAALDDYETIVTDTDRFASDNKDSGIGSGFVGTAKDYLKSAKQLMRRMRDKVPYSEGERMMLGSGGGWMVEGSPARLTKDYNGLVDSYNRRARF